MQINHQEQYIQNKLMAMLQNIVKVIMQPSANIQACIELEIKAFVEQDIEENKKALNKTCLFKILVSVFFAQLLDVNDTEVELQFLDDVNFQLVKEYILQVNNFEQICLQLAKSLGKQKFYDITDISDLMINAIYLKNYRDFRGNTLIFYAAQLDDVDLAKVLLQHQCSTQITCGPLRNTALHECGFQVFKLFVDQQQDFTVKNCAGQTALEYASERNQQIGNYIQINSAMQKTMKFIDKQIQSKLIMIKKQWQYYLQNSWEDFDSTLYPEMNKWFQNTPHQIYKVTDPDIGEYEIDFTRFIGSFNNGIQQQILIRNLNWKQISNLKVIWEFNDENQNQWQVRDTSSVLLTRNFQQYCEKQEAKFKTLNIQLYNKKKEEEVEINFHLFSFEGKNIRGHLRWVPKFEPLIKEPDYEIENEGNQDFDIGALQRAKIFSVKKKIKLLQPEQKAFTYKKMGYLYDKLIDKLEKYSLYFSKDGDDLIVTKYNKEIQAAMNQLIKQTYNKANSELFLLNQAMHYDYFKYLLINNDYILASKNKNDLTIKGSLEQIYELKKMGVENPQWINQNNLRSKIQYENLGYLCPQLKTKNTDSKLTINQQNTHLIIEGNFHQISNFQKTFKQELKSIQNNNQQIDFVLTDCAPILSELCDHYNSESQIQITLFGKNLNVKCPANKKQDIDCIAKMLMCSKSQKNKIQILNEQIVEVGQVESNLQKFVFDIALNDNQVFEVFKEQANQISAMFSEKQRIGNQDLNIYAKIKIGFQNNSLKIIIDCSGKQSQKIEQFRLFCIEILQQYKNFQKETNELIKKETDFIYSLTREKMEWFLLDIWYVYQKVLKKEIDDKMQQFKDNQVSILLSQIKQLLQNIQANLNFKEFQIDKQAIKLSLLDQIKFLLEISIDQVQSKLESDYKVQYDDNNRTTILRQLIQKEKENCQSKIKNYLNQQRTDQIRSSLASDVCNTVFSIDIHYKAFILNLKLFDELPSIVEKINKNQVILFKSPTGTGKSTLLPAFLLSCGFRNIAVTQPRRMPCKLICDRVQATFGKKICGYEVADESQNKNAPLIYMTDGLLRMKLQNIKDEDNFDIVMLDEIHERGRHIDLALAYYAEKFRQNSKFKTKLILCSATIDPKIINTFSNVQKEQVIIQLELQSKVEEKIELDQNPIELTARLHNDLVDDQQILVFLPSQADAIKAVEQYKEQFKRASYPLYAQQAPKQQEEYLKDGQIFFSTTFSETSLTFRNLKFVVDTGKLRTTEYSIKHQATDMIEFLAPLSTLQQRKGRLGRLKTDGVYYLLSDKANHKDQYHKSELSRLETSETLFQLLKQGFDYKKAVQVLKAIPDGVNDDQIQDGTSVLIKLGILDQSKDLTSLGNAVLNLPITNHPKMCVAIYHALKTYNCGLDLIALSTAIYMTPDLDRLMEIRNISIIDQSKGEIQMIIKILLFAYDQYLNELDVTKFKIDSVVGQLKLSDSKGDSTQIARSLKKIFNKFRLNINLFQSMPEYKSLYDKRAKNWDQIAKALITGYHDQTFTNCGYIGGNPELYHRLISSSQLSFDELNYKLRNKSILSKGKNKEPFIIALNINLNSLSELRGMIFFLGSIEKEWLIQKIKRKLVFEQHSVSKPKLLDQLQNIIQDQWQRIKPFFQNYKNFKKVSNFEVEVEETKVSQAIESIKILDKEIRTDFLLPFEQMFLDRIARQDILQKPKTFQNNIQENFKILKQSKFTIFNNLIQNYKKEEGVIINYEEKNNLGVFTLKNAKDFHCSIIQGMLESFISWFIYCKTISLDNTKVYPRKLNPYALDKSIDLEKIEEKIKRVTDPNLNKFQLQQYAGLTSLREQRMELVCQILICKYHCIVKGGFVRDWIIRGTHSDPKVNYSITGLNINNDDVVPKDLDALLPFDSDHLFDVKEFKHYIESFGISVEYQTTEIWRILVLFDRNRGAFSADLIQPFCQISHDMMDMDVSDLYIKRGFTKELGMVLPLNKIKQMKENQPIVDITLENIVNNISRKQFKLLRANVEERIKKMESRGWKLEDILYEIHMPNTTKTTVEDIKVNDRYWNFVQNLMQKVPSIQIKKIYALHNSQWDDLYEGFYNIIAAKNQKNANERILFHGTSKQGADGVMHGNFENSYFKDGAWGFGAYFADDPVKSHAYAPPDENGIRHMFICKVILGKQQELNVARNGMHAADRGFDSVFGTAFTFKEYIVYKFGQARPIFIVDYQ